MEFWLESNNIFVCRTSETDPSPERYLLHSHTTCELFYLVHGNGSFTVEGTRYSLSDSDVMLMRESERHRFNPAPGIECEYIAIQFMSDVIPENGISDIVDVLLYRRDAGELNLHRPSEEAGVFIYQCLNRICSDSGLSPADHVMLYLMPVFSELYSCRSWQNGESENTLDAEDRALLRHIMEYIDRNLVEIESIQTLENEFYFCASRINRLFRASVGESTWSYILRKRLALARDRMRDGESAAVAASACGFSDYSSFYRLFRKHFGVSPISCKPNSIKVR